MTDAPQAAAAETAAAPAAQYAPPPRLPRNVVGLVAMLLSIFAYVVPLGFLIFGIITIAGEPPTTEDGAGWAVLGAIVFVGYGATFGAIFAIAGIVLGIVSLFRKGYGKILGIAAIIIGVPISFAIFFLPLSLEIL